MTLQRSASEAGHWTNYAEGVTAAGLPVQLPGPARFGDWPRKAQRGRLRGLKQAHTIPNFADDKPLGGTCSASLLAPESPASAPNGRRLVTGALGPCPSGAHIVTGIAC